MSIQQSTVMNTALRSDENSSNRASYLRQMAEEAKQINAKLCQLMQRLDLFASQMKERSSSPVLVLSKAVAKVPAVLNTFSVSDCIRQGESAVKEKKLDEASKFYAKALTLACSKQEKAEAYWMLGNIAKNQKDFARAKRLFLQASSQVVLDDKLGIDVSLALGDVERQLGNFDKANAQYRQVYDPCLVVKQKILEPLSSDEQKAHACIGLGEIAKSTCDVSYAKKCFLEAMRWTRLLDVKRDIHNRLEEIAITQGKLQEANDHARLALACERASREKRRAIPA